jgi:uncharacterized protein with HEPN domain
VQHSEWQLRIQDMLDAIAEIQSFTAGLDLETFRQDRKTVRAVAYNFMILGEAARHVPRGRAGAASPRTLGTDPGHT